MLAYFSYLLIRCVLWVFRAIPFRVLYALSDVLRPILQHVIKYRRAVIIGQMKSCFPEWTPYQLNQHVRAFYRNLSDILLESIKGLASSPAHLKDRVQYINADLISQYLRAGRSVIMTGTHHCNWEWAAITVASAIDGEVVGVYKRLTNPYLETYVKNQRAGLGMTLMEMKYTLQALQARTMRPAAYVLMADQWPSNPKRAHWVTFMGRDTACLPGVDFISREHGFPVIYYEMQRITRGRYTISFSELVGPDTQMPEGAITTLNQSRMTEQVKRDPANWLWSHKRWKTKRSELQD